MTLPERYTVQLINEDGAVDNDRLVHIEATSPRLAAEVAFGRPLAFSGAPDRARAIVWRLTDSFSPASVVLYDTGIPQRGAADDPPSGQALERQQRDDPWPS